MVNSICLSLNCFKKPSFNFERSQKPLYCAEHKNVNMINVVDRQCYFLNCKTIPSFNIEGQKLGIFCVKHKTNDMVNVKSKRCAHDGCKLQPSFNYAQRDIVSLANPLGNATTKKMLYCSHHKLPNMIDIRTRKCIAKNCPKFPTFNFSHRKTPQYCFDHKETNMVNIKQYKKSHKSLLSNKKHPIFE